MFYFNGHRVKGTCLQGAGREAGGCCKESSEHQGALCKGNSPVSPGDTKRSAQRDDRGNQKAVLLVWEFQRRYSPALLVGAYSVLRKLPDLCFGYTDLAS